jgi:hypothetical protein
LSFSSRGGILGEGFDWAWFHGERLRMTDLLQQAVAAVQKLPDADQDAIASIILEEIADERHWDDALARSRDQLGRLADRVRQDIRTGKVKDVGVDEL